MFKLLKLYCDPGSSSGRTEDSGSSNGGSNPSPGVVLFVFFRTFIEKYVFFYTDWTMIWCFFLFKYTATY